MISRSSFGPRFLGLLVAFSDNYSKYRIVGRMFEGGHEVVQHENREYVRFGSDLMTNNAEVEHRLQCWGDWRQRRVGSSSDSLGTSRDGVCPSLERCSFGGREGTSVSEIPSAILFQRSLNSVSVNNTTASSVSGIRCLILKVLWFK